MSLLECSVRLILSSREVTVIEAFTPSLSSTQVMEEQYTVYFSTTPNSNVPYNPRGAVVPTLTGADFDFNGGASAVPSRMDGLTDIRSGNPNEVRRGSVMLPSR